MAPRDHAPLGEDETSAPPEAPTLSPRQVTDAIRVLIREVYPAGPVHPELAEILASLEPEPPAEGEG